MKKVKRIMAEVILIGISLIGFSIGIIFLLMGIEMKSIKIVICAILLFVVSAMLVFVFLILKWLKPLF